MNSSIHLKFPPLLFTSSSFNNKPFNFPVSSTLHENKTSQRAKTLPKPGIIILNKLICPNPNWFPVLSPKTPPAQTSQIPVPLYSSGSFLIVFLFTELIQLQMHSYHVMAEIRSGEFSWNMKEVGGGAGPAPAAHQYSVCAAALSGILGIQLGWGKNNCHCYFFWNFT